MIWKERKWIYYKPMIYLAIYFSHHNQLCGTIWNVKMW